MKKMIFQSLKKIESHIAVMNHSSERQAKASERMADCYERICDKINVIDTNIRIVVEKNWKLIFVLVSIITALVGLKIGGLM